MPGNMGFQLRVPLHFVPGSSSVTAIGSVLVWPLKRVCQSKRSNPNGSEGELNSYVEETLCRKSAFQYHGR